MAPPAVGTVTKCERRLPQVSQAHAALRDALRALPMEGDPSRLAMFIAKAHDFEDKLIQGGRPARGQRPRRTQTAKPQP